MEALVKKLTNKKKKNQTKTKTKNDNNKTNKIPVLRSSIHVGSATGG
jgi:hypothetical protein